MLAIEEIVRNFVFAFEMSADVKYLPEFRQTPTLRLVNGLRIHLKARLMTSDHV